MNTKNEQVGGDRGPKPNQLWGDRREGLITVYFSLSLVVSRALSLTLPRCLCLSLFLCYWTLSYRLRARSGRRVWMLLCRRWICIQWLLWSGKSKWLMHSCRIRTQMQVSGTVTTAFTLMHYWIWNLMPRKMCSLKPVIRSEGKRAGTWAPSLVYLCVWLVRSESSLMMEETELCFPQLLNASCRRPKRPHSEAVLINFLLSFISLLTAGLNLLVIIAISHYR